MADNDHISICPFLGLKHDSTLHMSFGSHKNSCHRCKPAVPIKQEHQNDYCLNLAFSDCPVYSDGANKRLPKSFRYSGQVSNRLMTTHRRNLLIETMSATILIIILSLIILSSKHRTVYPIPITSYQNGFESLTTRTNILFDKNASTPANTISGESLHNQAAQLPFSTLTASQPSTMIMKTPGSKFPPEAANSDTHPLILSPWPSSIRISPRSLEMPIGRGQLYIIHKVIYGENLTALADKYQTTVEAIEAVNYTLVIPIRKDALVIFPLGRKNPEGLPVLKPYQVTQDQLTIEDLIAQLKTDSILLRLINSFEEGEELHEGDWILVPFKQLK